MISRGNRIAAQFINGKTRLTSLIYQTPLRILETRHPRDKHAAAVMLLSHGGGMLGGDQVDLAIRAEGKANLCVTSGSNSQIYRCPGRAETAFTINGHLGDKAALEYLAEPIVLHAESRYIQRQNWRLDKNARLLVVDFLQAGRNESGESYDFSFYRSDLSIEVEGVPQMIESFILEPKTINPFSAAVTMGMNCIASVYYCAEDAARRETPAAAMPEKRRIPPFAQRPGRPEKPGSAAPPYQPYPGVLLGSSRTGSCMVTRIMGSTRIAVQPVLSKILHSLRSPL